MVILVEHEYNKLGIDRLVYTYDTGGNRLTRVTDSAPAATRSQGFMDGNTTGPDYSYDLNGNMTQDKNKGITQISYNYLNLPQKIVGGSQTIEYIYSASGQKLQKKAPNNEITRYSGNFIYEGNSLKQVLHGEGYIDMSGTPAYHYYLRDHLGNNRMVVNQGGTVVQQTDYYPFGMTFNKSGSSDNKYLYNGKELQEDKLGSTNLDWLDYGARMYDPTLGRWHSIDPMVENNHHDYTPYAYAYNNPILYIDPVGLDTTIYVFDQGERPKDNGTKGETYTAEIYIDIDGEIVGPYSGSSYPNSKSNSDNSTSSNTVKDGEHKYNNESGHDKGTKKGLNIDDSNNDSRTASGTNPKGEDVTMTGVNVHEGKSDNGNYNSRGSRGCVTINPKDSEAFFNNFDWSKNSAQTKGNSSGTIVIHRGNTVSSMVDKLLINIKKLF